MEDDIDAITPCAPMDPQQQKDEHHDDDEHMHSRRSSHDGGFFLSSPASPDCCPSTTACACSVADMRTTRSSSPTSEYEAATAAAAMYPNAQRQRRNESVRALEEGTDGDPARLWRRMLALQQHYGCYRSARMSAALESGDSSMLLREYPAQPSRESCTMYPWRRLTNMSSCNQPLKPAWT